MFLALAVLGSLGWLVYDKVSNDPPSVKPTNVQVNVPNPVGGSGGAESDDRIYVP
jgi:hypothetical protein